VHNSANDASPGSDHHAQLSRRLAALVERGAPGRGLQAHPQLPDVTLFSADSPSGLLCGVYEPCVAVIAQGRKQVALGDELLHYGRGEYLLASLDLPATSAILEASPGAPYLSVALRLDLREVAGLMLDSALPPVAPMSPPQAPRAMATGVLDTPLLDAFCRLLELVEQPAALPVLGPLVRREIHYRLLAGPQGWRLRQIVHADGQGRRIARAIAQLRERFREPLRVDDLAREAQMSVSTFHHHFKALTAMSPLQYQKQLRLTEARRQMLADDLDAATAAYRVGYESASQFSREYSRLFGAPPLRDIAVLRAAA
jgi:AraC-like DNA-binding protein